MYEISNSIVMECLSCTLINANIVIGYKLAYHSENLYISILEHQHDLKSLRSVQISILKPKNYPRSSKNSSLL